MGVSIVLTISKITNSSGQDFAQIWLQNNHFHSRPIHSPKNFKYFHSIVPQNHITFNSSQKTSFHQPVKSLIRLLIESLSNIQNLKDMTKYFFLPPSKIQNSPPPLLKIQIQIVIQTQTQIQTLHTWSISSKMTFHFSLGSWSQIWRFVVSFSHDSANVTCKKMNMTWHDIFPWLCKCDVSMISMILQMWRVKNGHNAFSHCSCRWT